MKTFAQYSTTTLTGDSGDEYVFEVNALDADLDAVGAVYAITRMEGDEHVVLYIGHTGNLSDRFTGHHKSECFDDNEVDCLCLHRDGNKRSRLRKETDLMIRYRPTCNGPKW
jgi:hypothetical protein